MTKKNLGLSAKVYLQAEPCLLPSSLATTVNQNEDDVSWAKVVVLAKGSAGILQTTYMQRHVTAT
jgi:hypothetical protein